MNDILLITRQTASESHQVFKEASGFDIMGRSQMFKWFSKFKHWHLCYLVSKCSAKPLHLKPNCWKKHGFYINVCLCVYMIRQDIHASFDIACSWSVLLAYSFAVIMLSCIRHVSYITFRGRHDVTCHSSQYCEIQFYIQQIIDLLTISIWHGHIAMDFPSLWWLQWWIRQYFNQ